MGCAEDLVQKLGSREDGVAERASLRADLLLRSHPSHDGNLVDESGPCVSTKDRTVINHKAFSRMGESEGPEEISKEAFMAQVERDAENRAKDRRERRKRSDEISREANKAFREKKFEKALELYTKAINETRDRWVLYENRALTSLQLKLHHRAVEDCNWALRLKDDSLKALLYKSKALFWLRDINEAEECIEKALEKHPQHARLIHDYKKRWEEDKETPQN